MCVYTCLCVCVYGCIYASSSTGHKLELEKLRQLENVKSEKQTMEVTHNLPYYRAHRISYLKISDSMYLLLHFLKNMFSFWQLAYLGLL